MSPTLGKKKPDVEAHQPRLLLFIVQLRNLRVPTRRKVRLQLRARVSLRRTLSLQRLLVLQQPDKIAIHAGEAPREVIARRRAGPSGHWRAWKCAATASAESAFSQTFISSIAPSNCCW
jgi:hypothetical protein